jgi:hypothetical protein
MLAVHTFTEGKLSGAFVDDVRKAFANKYPAEFKSSHPPSSGEAKNAATWFKSLASSPRNDFTPDRTRLLYLCLAGISVKRVISVT